MRKQSHRVRDFVFSAVDEFEPVPTQVNSSLLVVLCLELLIEYDRSRIGSVPRPCSVILFYQFDVETIVTFHNSVSFSESEILSPSGNNKYDPGQLFQMS